MGNPFVHVELMRTDVRILQVRCWGCGKRNEIECNPSGKAESDWNGAAVGFVWLLLGSLHMVNHAHEVLGRHLVILVQHVPLLL